MIEPTDTAIKWIAFSCPHFPLHNKSMFREHLPNAIMEYKPHQLICLGDVFEMRSASRWPSDHNWDLVDEYETANNELKALADLNESMKCVWLEGNHDANLLAVGRAKRDQREMLRYDLPQYRADKNGNKRRQINEHFINHWTLGARYIRHRTRGSYRIGGTFFVHGFDCGISGDEMDAIYFGQYWANSLTIQGHSHRPTPGSPKRAMKTRRRGLPFWYLNAGCSCEMSEMNYMDRLDREQWGNAFIIGWSEPINSPRLKKSWDAECILISNYED